MDSFYGADFLCESMGDLSFNLVVEDSGLEGLYNHVSDSVSSEPLGEAFVEVSSVGVEGGTKLDIDGIHFVDSVVVEPEEP
jgi:hypothetical protein